LLLALENSIVKDYMPHAPSDEIDGRIIAVFDGMSQIAEHDVVMIDRGTQDGIEVGHVLQIDDAGEVIRDVVLGGGEEVTLPDEEAGVLMVFRAFERVSYGLVMQSKRVIHRGDVVRTP